MKPRFSLKLLLIAVTVVAVFCCWRMQPARTAAAFRQTVERGDNERARKMICDDRCIRAYERDAPTYWTDAHAAFQEQSLIDWLAGRIQGILTVTFHQEMQSEAGLGGVEIVCTFPITSTAAGIDVTGPTLTQVRPARQTSPNKVRGN